MSFRANTGNGFFEFYARHINRLEGGPNETRDHDASRAKVLAAVEAQGRDASNSGIAQDNSDVARSRATPTSQSRRRS
jgi:hypothetical protein